MTAPCNDIDELALRLAECESGAVGSPADATVARLKAELDTIVAQLQRPQAVDEFAGESTCGKVTKMVQAIGQRPDEPNDKTIEHIGDTHKPSITAAASLGSLGVYELQSKLGEGGMGAVYKARHTKLDKIVAIKVLPSDRMKDKSAVARFEREMRAVGKLEHPNIVRAMDAGEVSGTHYLVMEYVQGVDLSQLVKERGPLTVADACELIRQAAVGLEEARESGMVHRDIKPSNLMLCLVGKKKPPVVKVLDMGLALLSEAYSPDAKGLTSTGQMMGTIDYMAPEQGGDSHEVDIRADIYSLGASLYKLLCGEAIYSGEKFQTPVQKMMALATQPAPPIQNRRSGVPSELAAVLHRMLEKNPAQRFATPEEVAQALAPFCAGSNLAALLNSVGFDIAPAKDAALSATQPSLSQPEGDTGVSAAPAKPPLPKTKPPVAASDKTNPALAKAPAPKIAPVAPAAQAPKIAVRPQATKTPAKQASHGKLPPWLPLAIGGGLLGFGGIIALAAALVFFFQTKEGTLRVEINDPAIEVTVKGTDIVLKQADKEEITLTPGEHTLTVKRGDFSFETRDFELKKGETTTVKVELLPGKVQVALADGGIIGEKSTGTPLATGTEQQTPVTSSTASDQAAVARWLLENKKLLNIGFDINGQVQQLNAVPSGPCKVRELNFHINNIGKLLEEDIPRLAVFTDLEWLDVSRSPLTDAGLASLAPMKKLKWLSLTDTAVTPAAVATIRTFPELEQINSPSTDEWLKLQAGMPSIRSLFYYRQIVSPQAMEWFKQYPNLTKLQIIECGDDWTSEKLAPLKDCKQLSKLEVSYVPIDDTCVELFSSLKGLVELNVTETKLTEAGLKNIAAALPACRIIWKGGVIEPTAPPVKSAASALRCTEPGGVQVPSLKLPAQGPLTLEAYCTVREGKAAPNSVLLGCRYQFSLHHAKGVFTLFAKGTNGQGVAGQYGIAAAPKPPEIGQTYHLAGVRTAEEFQLFIDGKKVAACPAVTSGSEMFKIGDACPVDLREIRVSSVVRYTADFTPATRFEPDADTLALYHCDEGAGDVLRDAASNKHDGKIIGAKWVKSDETPPAEALGFIPLFNNADLTGWNALRSASINWKNEAGTITGRNRSGSLDSAGVLQSEKQYRDFHLRCEVLAGSGAQPALLFRSGGRLIRGERHGYALTNPVPTSPSIAEGWGYGSLYADDFQVLPPQCRLAPAAEKNLGIKTGDWFKLEIIAQGEVVEIRVNGRQTVRYASSDPALNRAGSLGLRCQAGTTVAFRNVEIKELPDNARDQSEATSSAVGAEPAPEDSGVVRPASGAINLLPLIDPALDAAGEGGKREGDEIVIGYRSTLALPLGMAGGYRLRAEFTTTDGPKALSIACPIAGKMPSLILGEWNNGTGYVGAGLSGIDGLPAVDSRNPTHSQEVFLATDKRQVLELTASSAGDQATLRATVDGKSLVDWTGAAARLNAAAQDSTPQVVFNSYKGFLRLYTLELTMLDGQARLLRPSDAAKFDNSIDLLASLDPAKMTNSQMIWERVGDRLIGKGQGPEGTSAWTGFVLPTDVGGDYEVEIEFVQRGFYPVQIDVPLSDTALRIDMAGDGCGLHGLGPKKSVQLKSDVAQTLVARVRQQGTTAEIEVTLNGADIGKFAGERKELKLPHWVKADTQHVRSASLCDLAKGYFELRRAVYRPLNTAKDADASP